MSDQPQTLTELRAALVAAERDVVVASGLPATAERIAVSDKALARARAAAARATEAATEAAAALAAARAERADLITDLIAQGVRTELVAEAAGVATGRVSEIIRDRRVALKEKEAA